MGFFVLSVFVKIALHRMRTLKAQSDAGATASSYYTTTTTTYTTTTAAGSSYTTTTTTTTTFPYASSSSPPPARAPAFPSAPGMLALGVPAPPR